MGLQWGGWTYSAALLQGLLLGVVLIVLALRRSWLVLAEPVVPLAICIDLSLVGTQAH